MISNLERLAEPATEAALPVAIAARDLRKTYGDVVALDVVTIDVRPGEIVGVLGPNGAGKTTLIEILTGARRPTAGSVEVLGAEPRAATRSGELRASIGFVPQTTALPPLQTVAELVALYRAIYGHRATSIDLIQRLGLSDKRRSQIRRLSGGQRQRVALALALVGDPRILFLDEPTSELDPQSRSVAWELVRERAAAGCAAVLTTHQMEEAQAVCTRVAIIDRGRILACGAPAALVREHCPGYTLRFKTDASAPLDALGAQLAPDPGDPRYAVATLRALRLEPALERLLLHRRQHGFVLEELRVETATLADVFLQLTGREIRS